MNEVDEYQHLFCLGNISVARDSIAVLIWIGKRFFTITRVGRWYFVVHTGGLDESQWEWEWPRPAPRKRTTA